MRAHTRTGRPRRRLESSRLRQASVPDAIEPTGPRSRWAWRCYARLGSIHLLIFLVVFNGASILAARDGIPHQIYATWEVSIPLVPAWIWVYASMAVVILLPPLFLGEAALRTLGMQCLVTLLVSAAVFLAWPGELGFVREVPAEEPYRTMFETLFTYDRGNNLVPSLHVGVCGLCLLAFADGVRPAARLPLIAWFVAIMASTVLVHQHHLIDVAAGLTLVLAVRRLMPLPSARAWISDPSAPPRG